MEVDSRAKQPNDLPNCLKWKIKIINPKMLPPKANGCWILKLLHSYLTQ